MNWTVLIRPRAERDLQEAFRWYEKQVPGLGADFAVEFERSLKVLERAPERIPLYYKGFRRLLLRRFPYKVFYTLREQTVIIFRVLHATRDHTQLLD